MKNEASPSGERWMASTANLNEMDRLVEEVKDFLGNKAVYLDEEPFAQAANNASHIRLIKSQERRIMVLERELEAAQVAIGHAQSARERAEEAQRGAEAHARELLSQLENTTQVFRLHMEELRNKHEEVEKRNAEIKVLQAIIQTISPDVKGGNPAGTDKK